MRKPSYISPTSLALWKSDPVEYYRRYLSERILPREPQTMPMAVGSAFDALVKSALHFDLFGRNERFDRERVLTEQVDEPLRAKATEIGDNYLRIYQLFGAYDALLCQLGRVIGTPRFEMDIRGNVSQRPTEQIDAVPFSGKPDLFFINEHGAHCILDWKVNGHGSASGASPKPGYVKLREGRLPLPHASAKLEERLGILMDVGALLEQKDEGWARQLSIYSWLCGEQVGAPFVAMIHQIVVRPSGVRIAEHANYVGAEFQRQVLKDATALWQAIQTEHVFPDMTKEESDARCALIDARDQEEDPNFRWLSG